MNKEWKRLRIREGFVAVNIGEPIDLKINIILDNTAYSILNFGFSPVIWILSIAPVCVSNHTILETVFNSLIGC
jgi:hypothetical protein